MGQRVILLPCLREEPKAEGLEAFDQNYTGNGREEAPPPVDFKTCGY